MGKEQDQPLDLPPMAEMDMVADVQAAIRARSGLINGIVAEQRHEFGGIVIALPVRKIG